LKALRTAEDDSGAEQWRLDSSQKALPIITGLPEAVEVFFQKHF
jgi:hypothetical protein